MDLLGQLSSIIKIADALDSNVHKEKEKRVELNSLPEECKNVKPTIIKQGILKEIKAGNDLWAYCRIRMEKDPDKEPQYSLGIKNFTKNEESESEISKATFDLFYPDNLEKPQSKKRYKLPNGWVVDEKEDGEIIAEYEYDSKKEIKIPESFNIKKTHEYS